jgi:hypothetical protein
MAIIGITKGIENISNDINDTLLWIAKFKFKLTVK